MRRVPFRLQYVHQVIRIAETKNLFQNLRMTDHRKEIHK